MIFWRVYKAIFYDDKGDFVEVKQFSRKEKTFKAFGNKSFNINLNASYFDRKHFFFDKRYFYYNINNPNPILMNKKAEPIMDSESYNVNLETKVLRDLNELSKGKGWLSNLSTQQIIIILAIIGAIIYFATGGKITGE